MNLKKEIIYTATYEVIDNNQIMDIHNFFTRKSIFLNSKYETERNKFIFTFNINNISDKCSSEIANLLKDILKDDEVILKFSEFIINNKEKENVFFRLVLLKDIIV